MNRTEFNLQKAIDGAELVTWDGKYKAIDFKENEGISNNVYPYICTLVGLGDMSVTKDGKQFDYKESSFDLFLATPSIAPDQVKQYVLAHPDEVKKWMSKPVMVSHDGVELFKDDSYYSYNTFNKLKDFGTMDNLRGDIIRGHAKRYLIFSSETARQSYIDGLKPNVILGTEDGVEITDDMQMLFGLHNFDRCIFSANDTANRNGYIWFSTPEARHSYMVMNKPLLSVAEILGSFTTPGSIIDNLISLATSKLAK